MVAHTFLFSWMQEAWFLAKFYILTTLSHLESSLSDSNWAFICPDITPWGSETTGGPETTPLGGSDIFVGGGEDGNGGV